MEKNPTSTKQKISPFEELLRRLPMTQQPIVTLLTDFGTTDGFTGVMKGVMLQIAPRAKLVDISHHLPPFSISAAAFFDGMLFRLFPGGNGTFVRGRSRSWFAEACTYTGNGRSHFRGTRQRSTHTPAGSRGTEADFFRLIHCKIFQYNLKSFPVLPATQFRFTDCIY